MENNQDNKEIENVRKSQGVENQADIFYESLKQL